MSVPNVPGFLGETGPVTIGDLWAKPEGDELFALYRLAALTGMRRGEPGGLRWEDVDFNAQTVKVRHALAMVNGTPETATPKSRRSRRVIDIDEGTVQILRDHRKSQLEAAEFVGGGVERNRLRLHHRHRNHPAP